MRSTLALVTVLVLAEIACSQTRFELTAPSLNRTSQATLSPRELRVVDQEGRETHYLRAPALDSSDGRYLAYQDGPGGQVIRWPAANSGSMQIGTNNGGSYEFRTSQMKIVPLDGRGGPRDPNNLRPNQPPPPLPPGSAPILPPSDPNVGAAGDLAFFGEVLSHKQPQRKSCDWPFEMIEVATGSWENRTIIAWRCMVLPIQPWPTGMWYRQAVAMCAWPSA